MVTLIEQQTKRQCVQLSLSRPSRCLTGHNQVSVSMVTTAHLGCDRYPAALYGCHRSRGSEALKVKTSVMTDHDTRHLALIQTAQPAPRHCHHLPVELDVWTHCDVPHRKQDLVSSTFISWLRRINEHMELRPIIYWCLGNWPSCKWFVFLTFPFEANSWKYFSGGWMRHMRC